MRATTHRFSFDNVSELLVINELMGGTHLIYINPTKPAQMIWLLNCGQIEKKGGNNLQVRKNIVPLQRI
jgi:hypothetical protein